MNKELLEKLSGEEEEYADVFVLAVQIYMNSPKMRTIVEQKVDRTLDRIESKYYEGEWLRKNYDKDEKYIRIDLKVARSGKAYASLSTYKPNQTQGNGNGGYHGNPQQSGGNPGQGVTPENFKDDNFGEEIPF
ncbi:MAG: hypothetical protein B6229_09355 [Spirochaetaceae bacterium 4572_7]|nr:MAG: hypothetical protein B6229_09355 [Spirochaetaceae bacterium 4572_7]